MSEFNFEGSVDNIGQGQLEFINKVIKEQDIKVKKIKFEPVGKAGDNFVANVRRIIVEGEDRSLQLIAKIAPQNEVGRMLVMTTEVTMNEHIMYTEFLPKLQQMQIEAGVPEKDRLRYAKCYGSSTENFQEVILLEDLKLSEFIILDKFVSLNDTCVRSVLKNLAILHSFSFVLKSREPETFDSFKNRFFDYVSSLALSEDAETHIDQFRNTIVSVFDGDEELKNKIAYIFQDMIPLMTMSLNYDKHSVILQADPWTNNFMFRFKVKYPNDYNISKKFQYIFISILIELLCISGGPTIGDHHD